MQTNKGVAIQKIDHAIFYPYVVLNELYYMEFKQAGESEYFRSIFFTEPGAPGSRPRVIQ